MFGWLKSKKKESPNGLPAEFELILLKAFPNGDDQIDTEASSLQDAMSGKLSFEEARGLVIHVKVLLVVGEDKSLETLVRSIIHHESERLTESDAKRVYEHITGINGALFSGGNGATPEQAVVINCSITSVGVYAEYLWLTQHLGSKGSDWTLQSRFHGERPNGEAFETFVVAMKDGRERQVHFSISQWYRRN